MKTILDEQFGAIEIVGDNESGSLWFNPGTVLTLPGVPEGPIKTVLKTGSGDSGPYHLPKNWFTVVC